MFWIKVVVSGLIVGVVSELAKRYSVVAAVVASLPLLSILALSWLYFEERDPAKVIALSKNILWAILPSLVFFVIFPLLLKGPMSFVPALLVSCAVMVGFYAGYFVVLKKLGVSL